MADVHQEDEVVRSTKLWAYQTVWHAASQHAVDIDRAPGDSDRVQSLMLEAKRTYQDLWEETERESSEPGNIGPFLKRFIRKVFDWSFHHLYGQGAQP